MTTPVLDADVVDAALARDLSAWQREDRVLVRHIRTGRWAAGMRLANAIGDLAEASNHHPDLTIRYGSVIIRLTTHDAGGLTDKDLALARAIEALPLLRPDPLI